MAHRLALGPRDRPVTRARARMSAFTGLRYCRALGFSGFHEQSPVTLGRTGGIIEQKRS